jgi:two-component system sensor histidine kinase KdpD
MNLRSLLSARVLTPAIAVLLALAATILEWQLNINLASASVLNLLLVVFTARWRGIFAATSASIVAVISMDFLLIPPFYTFTIDDPRNWVALCAFETCALIVVRLSTTAELNARAANQERLDSQRLYEVSRQMLLFQRETPVGTQIVDLMQRAFKADAVILFDAELARLDRSPVDECPSCQELEAATRAAFFSNHDSFDPFTDTWYRTVRLGSRSMGALSVKSGTIQGSAIDSLASLAAIAIERARALNAESTAIAERQTEQWRTSVLDALAHEFKTPLTTIRAATGGLLGMNRLPPQERELAGLIDEASVRLTSLTTRALRTARLRAGEAAPKRLPVPLSDVVQRLLSTAAPVCGREIVEHVKNASAHLLADGEMLSLGLAQLLDNAIRYSAPGTPITVSAAADDSNIRISVKNLGESIPVAERSKIFERYYRCPITAYKATGTGLGLSVAKKIIEAHEGRLWVEGEDGVTTFVALLPRNRRSESCT